jgi:hypothetical protein
MLDSTDSRKVLCYHTKYSTVYVGVVESMPYVLCRSSLKNLRSGFSSTNLGPRKDLLNECQFIESNIDLTSDKTIEWVHISEYWWEDTLTFVNSSWYDHSIWDSRILGARFCIKSTDLVNMYTLGIKDKMYIGPVCFKVYGNSHYLYPARYLKN